MGKSGMTYGPAMPPAKVGKIQRICDGFKDDAGQRVGKKFQLFRANEYRKQLVAGVNYLIRVETDSCGDCVFLTVNENLRGDLRLISVETGKTGKDQLLPPN